MDDCVSVVIGSVDCSISEGAAAVELRLGVRVITENRIVPPINATAVVTRPANNRLSGHFWFVESDGGVPVGGFAL